MGNLQQCWLLHFSHHHVSLILTLLSTAKPANHLLLMRLLLKLLADLMAVLWVVVMLGMYPIARLEVQAATISLAFQVNLDNLAD